MPHSDDARPANRHPSDALLRKHAEGTIAPVWRTRVDRHLSACVNCRARYDALESLRAELAGLPRAIAPESDLWSGIRAVIAQPSADAAGSGAAHAMDTASRPRLETQATAAADSRRHWSDLRSRGRLAIAAVALLVLGAAAWMAFVTDAGQGAAGAMAAGSDQFARLEAPYVAAAAELVATIERRRDELPADVATPFTTALALIDEAVRETRSAVAADPDNETLAEMALAAHRRKLEFLQRVTQWSTDE